MNKKRIVCIAMVVCFISLKISTISLADEKMIQVMVKDMKNKPLQLRIEVLEWFLENGLRILWDGGIGTVMVAIRLMIGNI